MTFSHHRDLLSEHMEQRLVEVEQIAKEVGFLATPKRSNIESMSNHSPSPKGHLNNRYGKKSVLPVKETKSSRMRKIALVSSVTRNIVNAQRTKQRRERNRKSKAAESSDKMGNTGDMLLMDISTGINTSLVYGPRMHNTKYQCKQTNFPHANSRQTPDFSTTLNSSFNHSLNRSFQAKDFVTLDTLNKYQKKNQHLLRKSLRECSSNGFNTVSGVDIDQEIRRSGPYNGSPMK